MTVTAPKPAPPKPDANEQTAQAFTAQVKKEQEAVLALLKKWGVKPL
jgi:hypothetical protein